MIFLEVFLLIWQIGRELHLIIRPLIFIISYKYSKITKLKHQVQKFQKPNTQKILYQINRNSKIIKERENSIFIKIQSFSYNQIIILQTMQPQSIDKQVNTQPKRKLEILAVSDTHGSNKCIEQAVKGKSGDIFIHAGDFTRRGTEESFRAFFELLDKINFRYKIVIAGNHQIMLDNGTMDQNKRQKHLLKYPCSLTKAQIITQLKKRCIYLQHQAIEIEGVKIFGSPYTLLYCNTAFQYKPELDDILWSKVPKQVDILITHCPPFGILDKSNGNKNGGSKALQAISSHRKPKYHIFGHIHEGKGVQKIGETLYINVAKQPTRLQI